LGAAIIVLVFLVLSVYAVSADQNNTNHEDNNNQNNQVWCHKNHDGCCQEEKKDHCTGDWDSGRCAQTSPTPTPRPTLTPTPTPRPHEDCDNKDWKKHHEDHCATPSVTPTPTINPCIDGQCVTPTVTPTPTPTPTNPGGPGDGLSDGRSDGGSSCPECTKAPQGQVLGASTGPMKAVLGLSTTSGEESALPLLQFLGALTSGLVGFKFFKKNA